MKAKKIIIQNKEVIGVEYDNFVDGHMRLDVKPQRRDTDMKIHIYKTKHDKTNKRGLMNLWVKNKSVKAFINETVRVEVYNYDSVGHCRGGYNPTIEKSGRFLDFNYMLEYNKDNINYLVDEVIRRYKNNIK